MIVGQKEQIASVKCRLHAAAEYDDNRTFAAGDNHQTLKK
jgi:hypothetical protein